MVAYEKEEVMRHKFSVFVLIPVFLLITIDAHTKSENIESSYIAKFYHQIETTSLMFPEIKEEEKLKAIDTMKEEDNVIEADLMQKGSKIELVLTVESKTSRERAKELGESYVRLVKTFSMDINPNKKIGKGIYNYVVMLHNLNKETLIIGIKENMAESIAWQRV